MNKKQILNSKIREQAAIKADRYLKDKKFTVVIEGTKYKVGRRVNARESRDGGRVIYRWSPLYNEWMNSEKTFPEIFEYLKAQLRQTMRRAAKEEEI